VLFVLFPGLESPGTGRQGFEELERGAKLRLRLALRYDHDLDPRVVGQLLAVVENDDAVLNVAFKAHGRPLASL
jgi:hypothetical protein